MLTKTPFSKLAISQVLRPEISQMLNRWLAMNDQDKFNERVFVTVREMYTLVKNLLADVPTSQDNHSNHIELEATPPRFDKILLAQSEQRRMKSMGDPLLASEIEVSPDGTVRECDVDIHIDICLFSVGVRAVSFVCLLHPLHTVCDE